MDKLIAYLAPVGGVVATAASAAEQFAVTYGGLTIGAVGLGMNWYYNHKRLKLQERQQEQANAG